MAEQGYLLSRNSLNELAQMKRTVQALNERINRLTNTGKVRERQVWAKITGSDGTAYDGTEMFFDTTGWGEVENGRSWTTGTEPELLEAMLRTDVADNEIVEVYPISDGTTSWWTFKHDSASTSVDYVSVSYDSTALEFTVTTSSLPVLRMDTNAITATSIDKSSISSTMVFDKPGSNQNVFLFVMDNPISSAQTPKVLWKNSTVVASDTATEELETLHTFGYPFATVTLKTDGTWTITSYWDSTDPIPFHSPTKRAVLYVDTGVKRINYTSFYDEISHTFTNVNYTYTDPVDDNVILGRSYGSGYVLDIEANSTSYDDHIVVGRIDIDASNVVKECVKLQYNDGSPGFLGWTGSFDDSGGQTVSVSNGIITNVT